MTTELWQDFYESWASLLSLRSALECECAQQIFDAIATDESVLKCLGAAHLLKDAVIKQNQVPSELLLQLSDLRPRPLPLQPESAQHQQMMV